MDLGTLIGIVVGNGLILSAMLMGGTMDMFVDVAGLMIVFGGAVSACLMAFPMKDVIAAFKAAIFCMTADKMEPNQMVQTMCDLCQVTRKSGLVALSKMKFEEDFLRKAANLIAVGTEEDVIRSALTIEIDAMKARHAVIQDVFAKLLDWPSPDASQPFRSRCCRACYGSCSFNHNVWGHVCKYALEPYWSKTRVTNSDRSYEFRNYL
jgi:chemotaxis protein MotA